MTIRWLVAAVHLLAPGIGLGAVWVRGTLDLAGLRRVCGADAARGDGAASP